MQLVRIIADLEQNIFFNVRAELKRGFELLLQFF